MQKRLRKTGLAASIAILTLAVILAVGSTFSLFTSGDGNNITISSATVKVISAIKNVETFSLGVETDGGKFANLGTALSNGDAVTITNMTPGDEAKVTIGITNESTVLIAYRLKVTVTHTGNADDTTKITDVIKVTAKQGATDVPVNDGYTDWAYTTKNTDGTINNAIGDITVSILLPVEIGNDYQNDSMKVSFAIEAVQANAAELTTVTTADQLYAALKTNGNAILLNDITLDRALAVDGVATLDLNGKTLTGNIVNEGNLIIKDSMGAVTADASGETTESPSGKFVGSITNKGTLAITGGSFKNDSTKEEKTAIITNTAAAKLTIANADFASEGTVAIDNTNNATVIITSGSFVSKIADEPVFPIETAEETAAKVTVNGGSFSGEVPEEILGDNLAGAPDESGNIVISKVIINAGDEKYSTLQHALDEAIDVITLLESITLDEAVVVKAERNVTIDLNGKTITNNNGYIIENQGNLVITGNGTMAGLGIIRSKAGNITIENGNFYAASRWQDGVYQHTLKAENTNVVINGGNFDATVNGQTNAMFNASENGLITINGGSFKNVAGALTAFDPYIFTYEKNGAVVINNGSFYGGWRFNGETTTTKIYGGNFSLSYDGQSFHANSTHVVTVYGGTFAADSKFAGKLNDVIAEGAVKINNDDGTFTIYKAGDTIVMNAGATLDLGGVAFDGTIKALGDLTIVGHVKVANFDAGYNRPTITIGEGACLEITGSGRMVIGHGATFNITGTIADAKTANIADLTPSLIVAEGASFTGNGLTFNVTNAYVKFNNNSTSKNSNANGTFNFTINNSIWEQTGVLAFYVPTSGMDPTFNFTLKDSVLNTSSHLVFSVTKGEIVFDNSNVNVGTRKQIENRSTLTIKNGSVVNGAVATSSNAINPGTLIIENATYDVTGQFSGSGEGIGTLIIKKGAKVSIGSIIDKANIVIDANAIINNELPDFTVNLSKFVGEISFINGNMYEAAIDGGKIVVTKKPVASVGGVKYDTLEEAFKAVTAENSTVEILTDAIIDYKWDCRFTGAKFTVPVTINGNGNTITFTGIVNDGYNHLSAFRFEADATVNNLTIDMTNAISEFGGRFRAISAKGNLTVDKCKFIGNGSANNTRAIVFGEGAGANTVNLEISITNSTFKGWRRAISDNENAQDVKTVYIANNKFDDAGIAISANEAITVSNNVFTNSYVNITSYTANNALDVTATGNTLTVNADTIGESTSCNKIVAVYGDVNAQEGFIVYSAIVSDSDKLAAAIQKVSGGKIYLKAGDYTVRFTNNTSFNVDNITLIGIEDVTLSVSSSEAWHGRVQGSNVTFENIHFTSTVGATGEATYNYCTFDSWAICASSNNEKTYYNNCTINGCLNTSTDFSSGDVYAKNCSIEKAEYSGSMTMYFENCTIKELISWDAKTVLTGCTVTTLDDSHMSNNEIDVNP